MEAEAGECGVREVDHGSSIAAAPALKLWFNLPWTSALCHAPHSPRCACQLDIFKKSLPEFSFLYDIFHHFLSQAHNLPVSSTTQAPAPNQASILDFSSISNPSCPRAPGTKNHNGSSTRRLL